MYNYSNWLDRVVFRGHQESLKGLIGFQIFIYSWLKTHRDEYDVV